MQINFQCPTVHIIQPGNAISFFRLICTFDTKDMRPKVVAVKFRKDAGVIGAGILGLMEE